jgi:hypothetical protein
MTARFAGEESHDSKRGRFSNASLPASRRFGGGNAFPVGTPSQRDDIILAPVLVTAERPFLAVAEREEVIAKSGKVRPRRDAIAAPNRATREAAGEDEPKFQESLDPLSMRTVYQRAAGARTALSANFQSAIPADMAVRAPGTLECADLSALLVGDLSPSNAEGDAHGCVRAAERGPALVTSRQSRDGGDKSPHSKDAPPIREASFRSSHSSLR